MGENDAEFGWENTIFTTEEHSPRLDRPRDWRIISGLGGMTLFELGVSLHSFMEHHAGTGVGALVAAGILAGAAVAETAGLLPPPANSNVRGRY